MSWRSATPVADHVRLLAPESGRPGGHTVAFLNGHVSFVHVRKGLHVTADYTMIPFADLRPEACDCQQEVAE
jgi:hypothetical protein